MNLEDLGVEADSPAANGMSGVNDAGSPPADEDVNDPSSSPGEEGQAGADGDQEPDYSEGLMGAIEEAAGAENESVADSSESDAGKAEGDTESKAEDEQSDKADGEEKAEGEKDGEEGEVDENGEKLPPFHKHPRWQEMIRQRDDLKGQVESLSERASQYDQIHQYMETNGLAPQEVARAIQTMALIRNNPAQAREVLAQELEQLDQFVGKKLPEDLQRDVEDGYVTPERAEELARLRNQQNFTQQQAEQQRQAAEQARQQAEQQQAQQARQQALDGQRTAVQQWEADVRSRDPDYDRLQPLVFKELRLLAQERPAQSPDQAVELARTALKNVKAQVRTLNGPRETKKPGPSSTQTGSNAGVRNTPDSLLGAVLQAAGE